MWVKVRPAVDPTVRSTVKAGRATMGGVGEKRKRAYHRASEDPTEGYVFAKDDCCVVLRERYAIT